MQFRKHLNKYSYIVFFFHLPVGWAPNSTWTRTQNGVEQSLGLAHLAKRYLSLLLCFFFGPLFIHLFIYWKAKTFQRGLLNLFEKPRSFKVTRGVITSSLSLNYLPVFWFFASHRRKVTVSTPNSQLISYKYTYMPQILEYGI